MELMCLYFDIEEKVKTVTKYSKQDESDSVIESEISHLLTICNKFLRLITIFETQYSKTFQDQSFIIDGKYAQFEVTRIKHRYF